MTDRYDIAWRIWCRAINKMQRSITKLMNALQRHGPLVSIRIILGDENSEPDEKRT